MFFLLPLSLSLLCFLSVFCLHTVSPRTGSLYRATHNSTAVKLPSTFSLFCSHLPPCSSSVCLCVCVWCAHFVCVVWIMCAAHFLTLGIFYKLLFSNKHTNALILSVCATTWVCVCASVCMCVRVWGCVLSVHMSSTQVRWRVHKFAHWGVWVMCKECNFEAAYGSVCVCMSVCVCAGECVVLFTEWSKRKNEKIARGQRATGNICRHQFHIFNIKYILFPLFLSLS